jgi:putative addiction module component (TIGR02574 family)
MEYRFVMAGLIETLVSEAMQLPPDQRLTLAHRILSSVEPMVSSEIDAAWDTEIRKRIAQYDAGGVRSIPAAEIFAEVDRRLRR